MPSPRRRCSRPPSAIDAGTTTTSGENRFDGVGERVRARALREERPHVQAPRAGLAELVGQVAPPEALQGLRVELARRADVVVLGAPRVDRVRIGEQRLAGPVVQQHAGAVAPGQVQPGLAGHVVRVGRAVVGRDEVQRRAGRPRRGRVGHGDLLHGFGDAGAPVGGGSRAGPATGGLALARTAVHKCMDAGSPRPVMPGRRSSRIKARGDVRGRRPGATSGGDVRDASRPAGLRSRLRRPMVTTGGDDP